MEKYADRQNCSWKTLRKYGSDVRVINCFKSLNFKIVKGRSSIPKPRVFSTESQFFVTKVGKN
jgi:hypothetical protein